MADRDYIDLTRYYVVKSRYLSRINDLISFIYSINIGKKKKRSRLYDIFVVSLSFLYFIF